MVPKIRRGIRRTDKKDRKNRKKTLEIPNAFFAMELPSLQSHTALLYSVYIILDFGGIVNKSRPSARLQSAAICAPVRPRLPAACNPPGWAAILQGKVDMAYTCNGIGSYLMGRAEGIINICRQK